MITCQKMITAITFHLVSWLQQPLPPSTAARGMLFTPNQITSLLCPNPSMAPSFRIKAVPLNDWRALQNLPLPCALPSGLSPFLASATKAQTSHWPFPTLYFHSLINAYCLLSTKNTIYTLSCMLSFPVSCKHHEGKDFDLYPTDWKP